MICLPSMDSEKKIGLDLDGVCAEKPAMPEKRWGKMNGVERANRRNDLLKSYQNAKVLRAIPIGAVIVTARRGTTDVMEVTNNWFKANFAEVPKIYFLMVSRTVENVIAFKKKVLVDEKITHFYEDNKQILAGLKDCSPDLLELIFVAKDGTESTYWKRG